MAAYLMKTLLRFAALLPLLFAAYTGAAQAPPTREAAEFFEKSVRPVLVARCNSCHGEGKQYAGLRLDQRAAALKGGDMGSEIIAGDPDKSRLIVAIRQTSALKMPPSGKCTDKEIADLTAWVKMGAPWPADTKGAPAAADKMRMLRATHWSLQAVVRPAVPKIKQPARAANPIDAFLLADLDNKVLKPAKPASRTALIRRATFDLLGLPPTPEEEHTFVTDRRPDAYNRLIDRLLESPHYGERWARQWLDVARYSDTLGYLVGTTGRRFPYAYTYRDYVIRSLNSDKPYDQFILEQLAADQLTLKDKTDLAALGFITEGNRYLGDQQEIIDDRIDVVGRGLQGLTLGCARCHTHKFDPVPIEDYYSLYSIFNNGHEPETPPQIAEPANSAAFAAYTARLKQFETRMAEAKKKKDDGAADNIRREMLDFKATDPGAPPCAMSYVDNEKPAEQRVYLRGSASNLGPAAPARFLLAVAGDNRKNFTHGSGRLELAQAIASPANPLTARVMVNRIWLGHFGKGIVRTPSDFGVRGEAPTNQKLLDWLASEFTADVAHGSCGPAWSIKKMHRLIMQSAAYRQSADGDPLTVKTDPDNRLFGRMNRRRLDFEQMRDAILSVTGRLDLNLYGQPSESSETSRRRSIYTFLDRQSMPGLMRAFDFPDANQHSAQRSNTTVPQQNLFLLNSPFMQLSAHALASRTAVMEAGDARAKSAEMLALVYGRQPEAEEVKLAESFVNRMFKSPPAPPVQPGAHWSCGWGGYDPATGSLKAFHVLPRFTGSAWQGGDKLPDPVLGWVTLNAAGGHPGDREHAAIRRWTAPADMVVNITSSVHHPSPAGDGVLCAIVQNLKHTIASKSVAHATETFNIEGVRVSKGDTLDFVTDCKENNTSDSFEWAPSIQAPSAHVGPNKWAATDDFSGPVKPVESMSAWDVYAQALLMTNGFLYVD